MILEQLLLGGRQASGIGGKKESLARPEILPHGWEKVSILEPAGKEVMFIFLIECKSDRDV